MRHLVLALAAALGWLGDAAACSLPADAGAPLVGGPVQLAWRSLPARIAVSQPFELRVALCPTEARLVRVDATMPEHGHGMNYRPSVSTLGPGRIRVQGMLWHMAGRWELRFDVESGGTTTTLRQSVELK
jgi:hypothetical protein